MSVAFLAVESVSGLAPIAFPLQGANEASAAAMREPDGEGAVEVSNTRCGCARDGVSRQAARTRLRSRMNFPMRNCLMPINRRARTGPIRREVYSYSYPPQFPYHTLLCRLFCFIVEPHRNDRAQLLVLVRLMWTPAIYRCTSTSTRGIAIYVAFI